MANLLERLRQSSYGAGSTQQLPTEEKSRRMSYAGHTAVSTISEKLAEDQPAANPNRVSAMDINRNNVRRRASTRAPDDGLTCSQQSILSAMDRFVKSVNNMDATVLVPSRLRDMDFECPQQPGGKRPPLSLTSSDLFSFYSMLKDAKTELLWGGSGSDGPLPLCSGRSTPRQHSRQPSDDSLGMGSTGSDQDTDSDIDSVLTDRDSIDEQTSHVAVAFRFHLQGLYSILHQLAESADYLSLRYQTEVDAGSSL